MHSDIRNKIQIIKITIADLLSFLRMANDFDVATVFLKQVSLQLMKIVEKTTTAIKVRFTMCIIRDVASWMSRGKFSEQLTHSIEIMQDIAFIYHTRTEHDN